MKYLGNAFSLQMVDFPATINVREVSPCDVPEDCVSCIGHADTAAVVSNILGREFPANRSSIKLDRGDVLYVAQVMGGAPPRGCNRDPPWNAHQIPDGIRIGCHQAGKSPN